MMKRLAARLAALAMSALLAGGCGSEESPNRPPSVVLNPSPVEGDELAYKVDFFWSGTDPDGVVARFEYALDPPSAFTESEIAEGGPDIVTEVLPGEGDEGVTRVSKTRDKETVSFDWIHTRESFRRFTFSATEAESVDAPGGPVPSGRFRGMHALYVRALDDDGAASTPGKAAFTATTVAPMATILRPVGRDLYDIGFELLVRWTGTDPDADPGTPPSAYRYKVVDVTDLGEPWILDPATLLAREGSWKGTEESSRSLGFGGVPWQLFAVGVHAVDEAGAEEPFLEWGRNAFVVRSSSEWKPALTVRASVEGTVIWTGTGGNDPHLPVDGVGVPDGARVSVSWTGSAEEYFGRVWGYSWGVDVLQSGRDAGQADGEWSPWSLATGTGSFTFSGPGDHWVSVRCRDEGGSTTLVSVPFYVGTWHPTRDVLLVDDSYDTQFPGDHEHDVFWGTLFRNSGWDQDEFEVHGIDDRRFLTPRVPILGWLSQYRMVVWENFGSGYDGESALVHAASLEPTLRSYLSLGGQLWLGGRMSVAPCLDSPDGRRADLTYPIDADRLAPGTFAYDFLKLRSVVRNPKDMGLLYDFMNGVAPFPGGPAPYDSMDADRAKLPYPSQGIPYCDAMDPRDVEGEPGFRGDVDSLYAYRAYGPEVRGRLSGYHGKLVAVRWHDPDPQPLHGRIQWFGFPLYFMKDSEAQETFNRSLDWFREEVNAPTPGY